MSSTAQSVPLRCNVIDLHIYLHIYTSSVCVFFFSLRRELYSMFSFMYSDLVKGFIAFEWQWNQRTLHLHCITLGVDSSWHFRLQLYYNCSPRNQIMQNRRILL